MFRYERPQKGRQRQFHQLDVEVFGDPGPSVDAEVISLLRSFLTGLGLSSLTVVLNSLGCPECRPKFKQTLLSYLSSRKERLCADCGRRLEKNPLRILDCKSPGCKAETEGAPRISESLCPACKEHFTAVIGSLEILGIDYELEPRLVRGLDYYTRTAFEVHSADLGAQNAVAGGGRYDGLCARLGGPDIPAIGFAAGLERLIALMADKGAIEPKGPDYYAAVLCPEAAGAALRLVRFLRDKGFAVAADWAPGSLKSRLKRADKSGASKIVMLGQDELSRNAATVRDLKTGEQSALPLENPERWASLV
jgi:histidyl-tRNA synthetase